MEPGAGCIQGRNIVLADELTSQGQVIEMAQFFYFIYFIYMYIYFFFLIHWVLNQVLTFDGLRNISGRVICIIPLSHRGAQRDLQWNSLMQPHIQQLYHSHGILDLQG